MKNSQETLDKIDKIEGLEDEVILRVIKDDLKNYEIQGIKEQFIEKLLGDINGLTEDEILMINSAIVEAYQITGSRLYAVEYSEPGFQDAAIETYAPTENVVNLINVNENIVEEAKNALLNKINPSEGYYNSQRQNTNSHKNGLETDELDSSVEAGNEQENEAISTARDEFVTALDGTGIVGSENY